MSKTLVLEFNLSKGKGPRPISGVKQLAEDDGGQYYTRWVTRERNNPPWEPISAVEADAITREYNNLSGMREAARLRALTPPECRDEEDRAILTGVVHPFKPIDVSGKGTGVSHLEMAIEALRDMSDGDGPEDHLFAIGLALVALTERVDLAVGLMVRAVAVTEEIVNSLEQQRGGIRRRDLRKQGL